MYRIAIVDDDPIFLQEAAGMTADCMDADGLLRARDYEIDCFECPQALLGAMEKDQGRYQLLLLDIELGTESGLELAALLRKGREDFRLVYVTNYRDYVFDSFDTQPLHYLLKPLDRDKLASVIRWDYRRNYAGAQLCLKFGGTRLSLPYRDIYAVEAAQHRVLLHLRDRAEPWNGALSALAPELPGWCFCRCHHSFFINLSHVAELVRYEARMDNRQIIPISKRFYQDTLRQYFAFLKN